MRSLVVSTKLAEPRPECLLCDCTPVARQTESLRERRSWWGALLEGVVGEGRRWRVLSVGLLHEKLSGWRQGPGRRRYESTRTDTAQRHLAAVAAAGPAGKRRAHRWLRVCFTAAAL